MYEEAENRQKKPMRQRCDEEVGFTAYDISELRSFLQVAIKQLLVSAGHTWRAYSFLRRHASSTTFLEVQKFIYTNLFWHVLSQHNPSAVAVIFLRTVDNDLDNHRRVIYNMNYNKKGE